MKPLCKHGLPVVPDYRSLGFSGVLALFYVTEAGRNRRRIEPDGERLAEILRSEFVWFRRSEIGLCLNP